MRPTENIRVIAQALGEIFTVSEVATVLEITPLEASRSLCRWEDQGLVIRLRQGLYSIFSLDTINPNQPLENMWALVSKIFDPGYIGGWSAAEYWDFTEQIFRDICIFTEKNNFPKKQEILGISFIASHIPHRMNFGTEVVWIKNKQVNVSDPHKTIIDMLNNPITGGGIQHTVDCVKEYIKSKHFNPLRMIMYAQQMRNGAIFKRLGYLSEHILGKDHELTLIGREEITKGPSYMDPAIKKGKFVRRWNLYVPDHLQI